MSVISVSINPLIKETAMLTLPRTVTYAAAMLTLAGSLAITLPASAASMSKSSKHTASPAVSMADRVENRIKTLHDKLQITSAQEDAWGNVASAMRENETAFKAMVDEREKNGASMTAVDDLKSYQKLMQEHADNAQKVVDAFEPLYEDMTDAQKKQADQIFGSFEGYRGEKAMHGMHKMKAMKSAAPSAPAPQGN
jgi:LTXXQ motif family protein